MYVRVEICTLVVGNSHLVCWRTFGALAGIPDRTIQYGSRITGRFKADTAQPISLLYAKLLSALIDY